MDREEMKKHYAFGYRRFGPFLYGFVRWLKRGLEAKGYEKVFFFSRDGYMMKKAFDLINDTSIKSEYVCFSRKALRTPLLWHCQSFENSLKYLSRERFISVGKLLEYYGFDKVERESLAADGGFSLETDIPFDEVRHSNLARRLYEENKDRINSRSREQDILLEEYLRQTGMSGRFAIVDIGWKGNMQYYLELFFLRHNIPADMEGFYVGIDPVPMLQSGVNGYVFSGDDIKAKDRVNCFYGGYELMFQCFEGSTAGYERAGGCAVPRLAEYEYSGKEYKKTVAAISLWQRGALDFIRRAHAKGLSTSDERLMKPLLQFGTSPSLEDTRLFSDICHFDGTRHYFTPQKPMYRFKPRELAHALANSPWKTGFMRALFKIPGPYFTAFKILKK
ncbi:MAG: hypothetical protein IJ555_06725 [Ruminococcus sp.]|nr:hypothetical protein [Ruminococcus sp.]